MPSNSSSPSFHPGRWLLLTEDPERWLQLVVVARAKDWPFVSLRFEAGHVQRVTPCDLRATLAQTASETSGYVHVFIDQLDPATTRLIGEHWPADQAPRILIHDLQTHPNALATNLCAPDEPVIAHWLVNGRKAVPRIEGVSAQFEREYWTAFEDWKTRLGQQYSDEELNERYGNGQFDDELESDDQAHPPPARVYIFARYRAANDSRARRADTRGRLAAASESAQSAAGPSWRFSGERGAADDFDELTVALPTHKDDAVWLHVALHPARWRGQGKVTVRLECAGHAPLVVPVYLVHDTTVAEPLQRLLGRESIDSIDATHATALADAKVSLSADDGG